MATRALWAITWQPSLWSWLRRTQPLPISRGEGFESLYTFTPVSDYFFFPAKIFLFPVCFAFDLPFFVCGCEMKHLPTTLGAPLLQVWHNSLECTGNCNNSFVVDLHGLRGSWDNVKVAQLCPNLCYPCSPTGSSVHGIPQARILEWVAMTFCRGSSRPRDWIQVSCIADRFLMIWATRKPPWSHLRLR